MRPVERIICRADMEGVDVDADVLRRRIADAVMDVLLAVKPEQFTISTTSLDDELDVRMWPRR